MFVKLNLSTLNLKFSDRGEESPLFAKTISLDFGSNLEIKHCPEISWDDSICLANGEEHTLKQNVHITT